MGLHERYVAPRLCALVMRHGELVPYRRRVVALATGRVLEIGIGSALNLPFYGTGVSDVVGVDPSPFLVRMARSRQVDLPFKLDVLECCGGDMPLESRSFDTVLTTWTLCSVADPRTRSRPLVAPLILLKKIMTQID
jgi:SAM-dependent methyltransferase